MKKRNLAILLGICLMGTSVFASPTVAVTNTENLKIVSDSSNLYLKSTQPNVTNIEVSQSDDSVVELREVYSSSYNSHIEVTVSGAASLYQAKVALANKYGGASDGSYIYVYVDKVKTKAYYESYQKNNGDYILKYGLNL